MTGRAEIEIISAAASNELRGRDILCFANDWSGDPLSKTHLMRVLARDNRILWINAIANRMPTTSPKDVSRIYKKLKGFTEPIHKVEPNIFVLNPLAFPSYGNKLIVEVNQRFLASQVKKAMRRLQFENVVNMVFNPAAGMIAGRLGEKQVIYYCVDEYTAFTGASRGLKEIEDDLFRRADLVIVSGEKLFDSKKCLNPNTHVIRHGTDWQHFRNALDPELLIPTDIAALPRPIIGFHGLLADWVDYELIKKVAEHFKDGSVVLVGKITVDAKQKIKVLNDVANVHLLGRKPYDDLPAYCKAFDVALNPFEINKLTLAANPLKVREYLAAGLPVVSTEIPEACVLEDCLIGVDHDDFIRKTEQALANQKSRSEVSDTIAHESWESKVDKLREILSHTNKTCTI